MKPFNNRCKIEIHRAKQNSIFSELDTKDRYAIAKYLCHSCNNQIQDQEIYAIISTLPKKEDIFVVVENHMIEEIEFEGTKHYFVPIAAIVSFCSKTKSPRSE